MKLSKLRYITTPFWIIRNALVSSTRSVDFHIALQFAMKWLCKAQDATKHGGVSLGYNVQKGWERAFPETSGYIVSTFFNYFYLTNDALYCERAIRILEWLCQIQQPDGSICGIMKGAQSPLVFDTGQVLFGFLRGFQEIRDKNYLQRAIQAGDWLISIQDKNGKWSQYEFLNQIHTYNTRIAWALLILSRLTGKKQYKNAAEKNIQWALSQQVPSGWYTNNAFSSEQPVFTHTIAYATRGILECGLITENQEWIERASIPASALLSRQRKDGSLAGSYDIHWKPTSSSSCLTGNAQMAVVWLRLFQYTQEEKYLLGAKKAISFLVQCQEKSRIFPSIHGAIPGSWPIHGNYLPFVYPNWAVKFFADAILLYFNVTKKALTHSNRFIFY